MKVLGCLLSLLALSSCYYDNKEDLYQNFEEEEKCITDSVSYQAQVAVIMQTNCAISGCHLGPNGVRGLDLSQYSTVESIANSGQLVGRITGSTGAQMPPGNGLPQCEIDQIKAWVADGAPNN